MAVGEDLLAAVKRKLRITWDDPETDARLKQEIIPAAVADVRELVGMDSRNFDFAEGTDEGLLVLDHCWYQWCDAADEFEDNHAHVIARVRQRHITEQYLHEKETNEAV